MLPTCSKKTVFRQVDKVSASVRAACVRWKITNIILAFTLSMCDQIEQGLVWGEDIVVIIDL